MKKLVLSLHWFFCLSVSILAQSAENFDPPDQPLEIFAIRATEKIILDGILDEESWANAPVIKDFFRIEPRQGGTLMHSTEVRIIYDDQNIYIGVYARDTLGKRGMRMQNLNRDFTERENDVFLVQLDPQNLKRYCMSFQFTPLGTQRDMQVFDDRIRDADWDALWDVRTTITDTGYYGEVKIPFKSLRYEISDNPDSLYWSITFGRLARRDFEESVFPAIPQAFSPFRMTYAARLKGLQLPKPSANIRVQPYVLAQYNKSSDPSDQFTEAQLKTGGDIKWAIKPNTVLDLTFNTDFAQADVDIAVNNLQRFNIFFPERRQFFLENSGIWAGAGNRNIRPFFSRRIGLDGNFNSDPLRLNAGIRYIDRTENYSLAGMYINQESGSQTGASHFSILRYMHNYGKQNNIGAMLTHRFDQSDRVRDFNSAQNTTLTIDGFFRPKNHINVSYFSSFSHDTDKGTTGSAGNAFIGFFPNRGYFGYVMNWVTINYEPGMGFVFQKDVVHHSPGGYFIVRPKGNNWQWIRRFDPGIFINYYHGASSPGFQQATIYFFPLYLILKDNSVIEWAFFPHWQRIDFPFSPVGIRIEEKDYFYFNQRIRVATDASKKLSSEVKLSWGGFYNGKLTTLESSLRFAPIPHIAFSTQYTGNYFNEVGIDEVTQKVHLISGGIQLAANPWILFSGFYQYNSFDRLARVNLRFSWQFSPLSFLHIVFNENQFSDLQLTDQSTISKLSYMKQF